MTSANALSGLKDEGTFSEVQMSDSEKGADKKASDGKKIETGKPMSEKPSVANNAGEKKKIGEKKIKGTQSSVRELKELEKDFDDIKDPVHGARAKNTLKLIKDNSNMGKDGSLTPKNGSNLFLPFQGHINATRHLIYSQSSFCFRTRAVQNYIQVVFQSPVRLEFEEVVKRHSLN